MRPPGSSGRPSRATTGCGLTPAVQTTVRVGTTSPVESAIEAAVIRSTVVFVWISIPRRRSSALANAASFGAISVITRSLASTSTKRIPASLQRG
jgi:hypothetical protein